MIHDPSLKNAYREHAQKVWAQLDDNAKHGIRFGLFPADVMRSSGNIGFEDSRALCSALMDCANQDGGMRA